MAKYNKPLNRDYFKKRNNPKWDKKGPQVTKCCNQDVDHEVLNVKNKKDWELIEDYIEEKLREYSSTISITPVSCKTCGRLLEYISEVDVNKTQGYREKNN